MSSRHTVGTLVWNVRARNAGATGRLDMYHGGPGTTSCTLRGKPAAAVVRQILLDLERP